MRNLRHITMQWCGTSFLSRLPLNFIDKTYSHGERGHIEQHHVRLSVRMSKLCWPMFPQEWHECEYCNYSELRARNNLNCSSTAAGRASTCLNWTTFRYRFPIALAPVQVVVESLATKNVGESIGMRRNILICLSVSRDLVSHLVVSCLGWTEMFKLGLNFCEGALGKKRASGVEHPGLGSFSSRDLLSQSNTISQ